MSWASHFTVTHITGILIIERLGSYKDNVMDSFW